MEKTKVKVALTLLALLIFAVGLQAWHPWQRQTDVFYEPVMLPLEVIKGDVIVMPDGTYLVIDENKKITSIDYDNGVVTMRIVKRVNLWSLMTK